MFNASAAALADLLVVQLSVLCRHMSTGSSVSGVATLATVPAASAVVTNRGCSCDDMSFFDDNKSSCVRRSLVSVVVHTKLAVCDEPRTLRAHGPSCLR